MAISIRHEPISLAMEQATRAGQREGYYRQANLALAGAQFAAQQNANAAAIALEYEKLKEQSRLAQLQMADEAVANKAAQTYAGYKSGGGGGLSTQPSVTTTDPLWQKYSTTPQDELLQAQTEALKTQTELLPQTTSFQQGLSERELAMQEKQLNYNLGQQQWAKEEKTLQFQAEELRKQQSTIQNFIAKNTDKYGMSMNPAMETQLNQAKSALEQVNTQLNNLSQYYNQRASEMYGSGYGSTGLDTAKISNAAQGVINLIPKTGSAQARSAEANKAINSLPNLTNAEKQEISRQVQEMILSNTKQSSEANAYQYLGSNNFY